MSANPIPSGYHSLTPYLNLERAADFLEFAKKAFGAEELHRMQMPNGKIGHALLKLGDSMLMVSDAMDRPPAPAALFFYVNDCDSVVERAVAAGAQVVTPPTNQFWGDRHALLRDGYGNAWNVATHVEDLTPDEMNRRAVAAMAPQQK